MKKNNYDNLNRLYAQVAKEDEEALRLLDEEDEDEVISISMPTIPVMKKPEIKKPEPKCKHPFLMLFVEIVACVSIIYTCYRLVRYSELHVIWLGVGVIACVVLFVMYRKTK